MNTRLLAPILAAAICACSTPQSTVVSTDSFVVWHDKAEELRYPEVLNGRKAHYEDIWVRFTLEKRRTQWFNLAQHVGEFDGRSFATHKGWNRTFQADDVREVEICWDGRKCAQSRETARSTATVVGICILLPFYVLAAVGGGVR